jgi:hypothetical protein
MIILSFTESILSFASRIEQLNKELISQLLVSGEVFKSVYNNVASELIRNISLKGWMQPVTIYKLA